MRKIQKLSFFLGLSISVLTSCTTYQPQDKGLVRFTDNPRVHLNVKEIEVIQEYNPPLTRPNVEHLMPATLSEAVETWANDRISPVGDANRLRVVIKDASVIEETVARKKEGFFEDSKEKKYTARLEVVLEIYEDDESLFPKAEIQIDSNMFRTTQREPTLNQQDEVYRDILKKTMVNFNSEFEKNTYYFNKYMATDF